MIVLILESPMTEFSCLDCKHHIHYYNSPSMGEGEPELEFYCEHELNVGKLSGKNTENCLINPNQQRLSLLMVIPPLMMSLSQKVISIAIK